MDKKKKQRHFYQDYLYTFRNNTCSVQQNGERCNRTPFVCVPCRERPPVEVMDVSLCDDSISESESDNESVPESDHESVPEPGKETESETESPSPSLA